MTQLQLFPILGRGHSGGRILCEVFRQNQIQMGRVSQEQKDTIFFSANQPLLRKVILNAFFYSNASLLEQQQYQEIMRACMKEYIEEDRIDITKPFGWKHGISLFSFPVVLDAFPSSKIIHLIRDGRDVMLSRLNARIENLHDPVNRLAVFGDIRIESYEGQPLTADIIKRYRNELEMWHWVTAVQYLLQGRKYPDRYLEVKYEELCQAPIETCANIFSFLGLPFYQQTQIWISQNIHRNRIGKWRDLSDKEMAKPIAIGKDLLMVLGYL